MNPSRTLIQEAIHLDIGIGKASTKILQTHLEFYKNDEEKDKKMVATLLHAINHCPGRYLEGKHLDWRNRAEPKK